MRILETYSHLNGEEYLVVHHPGLYDEIKRAVEKVDAFRCRTKASKEKTMRGKLLFSPERLNKEFSRLFRATGWRGSVYRYLVTISKGSVLPISIRRTFFQGATDGQTET
jgi:hypothetical protein